MTKKELREKIEDYLLTLDNNCNEEWWCTDREKAQHVLDDFIRFITPSRSGTIAA